MPPKLWSLFTLASFRQWRNCYLPSAIAGPGADTPPKLGSMAPMAHRGGDASNGIAFGEFGANDSRQRHVLEGLKVEGPTPGTQYHSE